MFAKTQNCKIHINLFSKKENCNRQISLLRPMSVFYYKYVYHTEDGGIQKIHKSTLKGIKRCKIANNDTGISRFFPIFFFLEKTGTWKD